MNPIKKTIHAYSQFISNHPYLTILFVILISSLSFYEMQSVQVKSMGYKNMLPKDLEVIQARDIVTDSFGGMESAKVAIELDTRYLLSNEKRDIRDPEVLRYIDLLTQQLATVDDVITVSSASSVLKQANNNRLPKTKLEVSLLLSTNPTVSDYFSRDYTLSIINLQLSEDIDEQDLVKEMQDIIAETEKPSGITAMPAGDIVAGPIVNEQIGPDMTKTSNYSLIGIIVILLVLFRSLIFGLTPLAAIGVGVIWAFGYIGLMKLQLSSATSGVISMIMGIGIDFGIQVSNRFRQELDSKTIEQAMEDTLNNVIAPMLVTTLAALIGFSAMSMGQLSFLEEMGKMMSYGITACFLAAITIVPALLIIFERFAKKNKGMFKSMFRKNTKKVKK